MIINVKCLFVSILGIQLAESSNLPNDVIENAKDLASTEKNTVIQVIIE